jgi:hypothetical protein
MNQSIKETAKMIVGVLRIKANKNERESGF